MTQAGTRAVALTSNKVVDVEYDAIPNDDGSRIVIRRTVWGKAGRGQSRSIVHMEDIADLSRIDAQQLITALVSSLI